MRILISGASGLVGKALSEKFSCEGHSITGLSRNKKVNQIYWDPENHIIDISRLSGFDGIVHLAGENIFGLWTRKKKKKIYESRVDSTKFLCESLLKTASPPKVFLSASAVGYYGDRGEEVLNDDAKQGSGFLSKVCVDWERASEVLKSRGTRICYLRFGVVLSDQGGALKTMLPAFKLGLGGKIGRGDQYMSWILIDDLVSSVSFILNNESLSDAINIVSPMPVTNIEFTKALGRAVNKRTPFSIPTGLCRLLTNGLGKELLLASTRAYPKSLLDSGFKFKHADLNNALSYLIKDPHALH